MDADPQGAVAFLDQIKNPKDRQTMIASILFSGNGALRNAANGIGVGLGMQDADAVLAWIESESLRDSPLRDTTGMMPGCAFPMPGCPRRRRLAGAPGSRLKTQAALFSPGSG